MDLEWTYEISRVAEYVRTNNFRRVALQFPDELLKDSTKVASALRRKLRASEDGSEEVLDVGLYVMADTAYGSCCVDEVGASHVSADCVIHYGHTCFSPTTNLPALYVFGKATIDVSNCAKTLCTYALSTDKPILVLFGLEYSHALQVIMEATSVESSLRGSTSGLDLCFADVMCPAMHPSKDIGIFNKHLGLARSYISKEPSDSSFTTEYQIGGLRWSVTEGRKIEDYSLFWIGSDNSAFSNVVLTFNSCDIVRFDASENRLVTDFSQQKRILKRRYYLVEKAKDAAIVGILVGTLGVAGYLHMIHQIEELITGAGKKAYTLAMGKPNPAKLANFPECDVFIYVSCAQTALLDSKEFLAPVITPFEAILAFDRGSQWTGAYVLEFQDLIASHPAEVKLPTEEARFSFLSGGYVEDIDLREHSNRDNDDALALVSLTEKALQVRDKNPQPIVNGTARSGVEYFASRSFQGLDINGHSSLPEPFFVGRTGKASGYKDERVDQ